MRYENIVKGRFLARPNRFTAQVEINGRNEICHVKNTGRCRELLVRDCTVYLDKAKNPDRKTKYDLVAVEKGQRLINMDSYAPNIAAGEFLPKIFQNCIIKPEYTYGNSRFDFYIENNTGKILLEVKGVTLEEDGVVMFPDAPTERGLKHVNELTGCTKSGYEAYLLFVIQMDNVKYFTPNYGTHPEFGEALKKASRAGVKLLAYDCAVTPNGMEINSPVCIKL